METSPISWFWRLAVWPVSYVYSAHVCIYNTLTHSVCSLSSTSQKSSSAFRLPLHLPISCYMCYFSVSGPVSFLSVYNNHPTHYGYRRTASPPHCWYSALKMLILLLKWMAISSLRMLRMHEIKYKLSVCQSCSVGTWPLKYRPAPILPSQKSSLSPAF